MKKPKPDLDYDGIAATGGDFLAKPGPVTITNDVGGTTPLPAGDYKVKLIGGFNDEETGRIFHARLVDPAQVEIARKAGQVHQPGWKTPRLPDGAVKHALDSLRVFDPSFVIFSEFGNVWRPRLRRGDVVQLPPQDVTKTGVEQIIAAAVSYGEKTDDLAKEGSALADVLEIAWNIMSPEQRADLLAQDVTREVLGWLTRPAEPGTKLARHIRRIQT